MTTPIQDDSVSDLILEIADCEARRARLLERPEWFGPIEQLQLVAAGSSEPLLDVADEILGEVESHGTKHFYPCRCYDLQELLSDRIQPILQEYADLSRDIEKLKRHVRFGANVSNPTARGGGDGLSGTEIEKDR